MSISHLPQSNEGTVSQFAEENQRVSQLQESKGQVRPDRDVFPQPSPAPKPSISRSAGFRCDPVGLSPEALARSKADPLPPELQELPHLDDLAPDHRFFPEDQE